MKFQLLLIGLVVISLVLGITMASMNDTMKRMLLFANVLISAIILGLLMAR